MRIQPDNPLSASRQKSGAADEIATRSPKSRISAVMRCISTINNSRAFRSTAFGSTGRHISASQHANSLRLRYIDQQLTKMFIKAQEDVAEVIDKHIESRQVKIKKERENKAVQYPEWIHNKPGELVTRIAIVQPETVQPETKQTTTVQTTGIMTRRLTGATAPIAAVKEISQMALIVTMVRTTDDTSQAILHHNDKAKHQKSLVAQNQWDNPFSVVGQERLLSEKQAYIREKLGQLLDNSADWSDI